MLIGQKIFKNNKTSGRLKVGQRYNCKVIFTTRSKFESAYTYKLKEISDINILADFAGSFYSDIENNRDTAIKIIEAVHRAILFLRKWKPGSGTAPHSIPLPRTVDLVRYSAYHISVGIGCYPALRP